MGEEKVTWVMDIHGRVEWMGSTACGEWGVGMYCSRCVVMHVLRHITGVLGCQGLKGCCTTLCMGIICFQCASHQTASSPDQCITSIHVFQGHVLLA